MRRFSFVIFPLVAACAPIALEEPPSARPADGVEAPAPPPDARTPEQFDTTTNEQRAAAASSASGGRLLGAAVVSLGDPTDPGFWIETPLVSAVASGRVVFQGQSVEVELRPGASSRASLATLRLLQAPLTELTEVSVYAG